ncbi:unnamed protein product [Phytophthora fragariaefolia]|uniref:Unnamed protein product n=1 Tax=Phytophthora fragariaefolia TaxID=1490495 RepID=A0A9W6XUZ5_9STRA|nr:unnamed protein product [Phytophthora fragariaefolia]
MTAPFDVPTRLGTDPFERQATLLRVRQDRLQFARQFMFRQWQCMGIEEYSERKKFKAANGDLVSLTFEIVPLPEAQTIKSTVEALRRFDQNIEISISEASGDITVRENDDATSGCAVIQHRLVTKVNNKIEAEANNVAFGEYCPATRGQQEQALMVCDVVEEDEIFPYRRSERLRQDVITIISLVSHQDENGKPVIVMTRWLCQRIHKSPIHAPQFVINRIRSNAEKVADAMLTCLAQPPL